MPKTPTTVPKEILNAMDAATAKALKYVLRDEMEKLGRKEADRIARKLIADNRVMLIKRIEVAAQRAFKKTLADRVKKFVVDISWDY